MAAQIKLYIDWVNKRLVTSARSSVNITLATHYYGDVYPYRITLLEPNPTAGVSKYSVVPIDNISLKYILHSNATGDGTDLVTQFTWSKNTVDQYFYATVAYNTAALDTFLGALSEATAYLMLQITEGSSVASIYKSALTVGAALITPATLEVPPGQTAISLETATAMFAQKEMGDGESLTLKSPDGTKEVILYVDDDGIFHSDPI